MKVKFSSIGLITLILILLWQVESRIYDPSLLSYLFFLVVISVLFLRVVSKKKFPLQIKIAFWLSLSLFIVAFWSLQYSANLNWSLHSLAVFLFRLLVLMLAAILASEYGPEFILRKMDIVWYATLLIILAWLTPGLFKYFNLTVNYQNAGASLMLCLLPIFVYQKKHFKVTITIIVGLLLGSRMAFALILLFLIYYYLFYLLRLRLFNVLAILTMCLLSASLIYYLDGNNYIGVFIDTYNPINLPDKGELDMGRRLHNYHGLNLLEQYWFSGSGIGTFQLEILELMGREMSPHNFIFFFLVQMGIFSLILFLILVYYSVKPLWRRNKKTSYEFNVYKAVGMSNLLSFGYFFTRPQLDNIMYFMMIGIAIGMMQRRSSSRTRIDSKSLIYLTNKN